MKLTPIQQRHVNNVTTANLALREAQASAAAEARAIVAEKVAGYQRRQDLEVSLAIEAGVPKKQLHRKDQGLHSSNPGSVYEALERHAAATAMAVEPVELEGLDADPLASRYALDAEAEGLVLTVTLDGQALSDAFDAVDFDMSTVPDPSILGTARFAVTVTHDGRTLLDPLTAAFLPDWAERHPVVAWVASNEAEALEWLGATRAAVAA